MSDSRQPASLCSIASACRLPDGHAGDHDYLLIREALNEIPERAEGARSSLPCCCQPTPFEVRQPSPCTWPGTDCYENGPGAPICPDCGWVLSRIHDGEWWCERCPWDGTERDLTLRGTIQIREADPEQYRMTDEEWADVTNGAGDEKD